MNEKIRTKTTVVIPSRMLILADECGRQIGVGRNGFISLALALTLVQLHKVFDFPKKRCQLLMDIESEFQRLMTDAKRNS